MKDELYIFCDDLFQEFERIEQFKMFLTFFHIQP